MGIYAENIMRDGAWHIDGKSVLITGAAGGIGAATARLLAARHARLSLVAEVIHMDYGY
jgi:NADP-dependent 3-hydroxy acid dehydrogenase YdfG